MTPALRRWTAALLGAAACTAQAQPAPAETAPPRDYLLPAAEIVAFDFLLNRYNHRFSGSTDYDVSGASVRRNLRGPWVTDNDPFSVNQFAHPYQGSLYHGAARSAGLGYWTSVGYTFVGSLAWEIAGEQTPPARNDQVASGIAGSFLGEPLFRMARLVLNRRGAGDGPDAWRSWAAAAISPPVGLNRALFGSRFDAAFDDHDPVYYSRLRLGAERVAQSELGSTTRLRRHDATVDFALDYGLPGQPGYTYHRPFDYFAVRFVAGTGQGVRTLSTQGLLLGTDYAMGDRYRGVWGVYGHYDYFAPQLFNLSATGLSIGTTAQWWLAPQWALQGTALAGVGYAAASTQRGAADDRDYHYGMAPQASLALRLIAGSRWSLDTSAQKFFVGHIANRTAGHDDLERVDAALTWRVSGRHAVGMQAVRWHRDASYPVAGDRSQTLTTVGVYYTLLGLDTFGTVEWRR